MGVIKFFSAGSSSMNDKPIPSYSSEKKFVSLPNPDPENYDIVRWEEFGGYTIVNLKYHDCVNYDGNKILVFECSIKDLIRQKKIDPHFLENEDYLFPIARFVPTDEGWAHACRYVDGLIVSKKLRIRDGDDQEVLKDCAQKDGSVKKLRITNDQINRLAKIAQNIADEHWHDDDVSGGYIDDDFAKETVESIYDLINEIEAPDFENMPDGNVNGNE